MGQGNEVINLLGVGRSAGRSKVRKHGRATIRYVGTGAFRVTEFGNAARQLPRTIGADCGKVGAI